MANSTTKPAPAYPPDWRQTPSRMCTPTSGPKLSCGCVDCHEARKRS